MPSTTRRAFLSASAACVLGASTPCSFSLPVGIPLGLQLYSCRVALARDYAGTLQQVSAAGYREVEAAGFFGHTAGEVKTMMASAGLRCIGGHYPLVDLLKAPDETIAFAKEAGLSCLICASPSTPDPARPAAYPGGAWQYLLHQMTADDWKWNAEQFNRLGEKVKAAGLRFGYHNHTPEFRDLGGGQKGYDILLANTEPSLVTFELDCGWAAASGQDAAAILRRYSHRISLLHLKDLKPAPAGTEPSSRHSTILGQGVVDYAPILAAAKAANIRQAFIEQEEFDGPVFEALKEDLVNARKMMA
ncbi:sugar phosphate isomerase/epimerase family protein [Silvibacterium dinghuense]|uniref:sugar phosphate isomerase/epimerase family protein n=1 Tax=Silvibacterium dinghuense TaxID=1560006 RepID=UPI001E453D23|nr:sugar phosphate isomerase/epimerase [Silvibacterium dinghuense]